MDKETIKQLLADGVISNEVAAKYFPELKESEDEKIRKGLIALIKECLVPPTLFRFGLNKEDTVAWLEKQGEQKPAWSEEDENLFRCAIDAVKQESKVRTDGCLDEEVGGMVIEWLKSLRPQNHNKWHSIDEKPVYPCNILYKAPNGNIFLFKYMEDGRPAGPETSYLHSFDAGEWMYLKDIESQSHWKPSDEQMKQLHKYCPDNIPLTSLYEQLKKLKG